MSKLYTSEVLALATRLARWPLDPAQPHEGRARSPTCGSTLAVSLQTDGNGRIVALGLTAQACAVGQASAAIFAAGALGQTRADVQVAFSRIYSWLKGEADLPDWPGFSAIAAARDYPARHGAILLAWQAALDALP